MKIIVQTIRNKKIRVEVEPGDTIQDVKAKIQEIEGTPADQMRLVVSGLNKYTKLEDNKSIDDYEIQEKTLIHMDPENVCGEEILTNKQRRLLMKKLRDESMTEEEKAAKLEAREWEKKNCKMARIRAKRAAEEAEAASPTKKAKNGDVSYEPLEMLKQGKGPKMIIAQNESTAQETPDENTEKPLSKTQQKKLKRLKREQEGMVHETKSMLKCMEYIKEWKKDRESWKFNKNHQSWIINHLYDKKMIHDSFFSLALEYVPSVRGGIREVIQNKAKEKIKQADELNSLKNDEAPKEDLEGTEEKKEENGEETEDKELTKEERKALKTKKKHLKKEAEKKEAERKVKAEKLVKDAEMAKSRAIRVLEAFGVEPEAEKKAETEKGAELGKGQNNLKALKEPKAKEEDSEEEESEEEESEEEESEEEES